MRRGVVLVADEVDSAKWRREFGAAELERTARPRVHWLRDLYIASSLSVVVLVRWRERDEARSRRKEGPKVRRSADLHGLR